jgi:hypothetical protein
MLQYEIQLEPLCEVVAFVSAPIPVGPSSWGVRSIAPIVEGTFEGPRIKGVFLPIGADFILIRADNCAEIDVRAVLQTDDGAYIYTTYHGIVDMTEAQVQESLAGRFPADTELFVTPRFETAHPNYQWLNRVQAVGRGHLEPAGDRLKVTYSWYALRA